MHILHLIKTSEGASWVINLLRGIKLSYPDVSFSVIITPGGKWFDEYKALCKGVYEFDYSINLGIIEKGYRLRRIVKQENPDIIHSWFTQTTLFARAFLRDIKTPRIFQVVGPAHLEYWAFKKADILSAQKDDYWIATSDYIKTIYNKTLKTPKDKVFFNYAYVNLERYKKELLVEKGKTFREKLGISEFTKIIGTASYIYPPKPWSKSGIKNHELLLKVFSKLLETRNDVVLVIAGETFESNSRYEEKLKHAARKIDKDRIFFTGKYTNPLLIIPYFDVFVYLSKSENLGGVFESLLFGVPTVSSNRGGLPELVVDNETGFLCDLEDEEKIIRSIQKVLNAEVDLKKIKSQGRQKVLEVFDEQRIVEKSYSIYSQLAKMGNSA